MAPKLKTTKGKASEKLISSPHHPVELDTDSDDGSRKQVAAIPANGNEEDEHLEQQAMSEAGSYDGELTDPALFDEEETPNIDGKKLGGSSTGWPGSGGGYNAMKSHNGQYYSGMAIGGSHTWNYQPGVWKETKEEPDLWEIDYATNKVRNHKAPAGSGAPVGTEYHWYIIAHQHVKKIDANTYETHLTGSKYKLAHKNVNAKHWDIPTVKGQREREMFLLDDAKRRIEGLPPVLTNEKIKVDKKEKGQATLGAFFQTSPAKKRKERSEEELNKPLKKAAISGENKGH